MGLLLEKGGKIAWRREVHSVCDLCRGQPVFEQFCGILRSQMGVILFRCNACIGFEE